MSQELFISPLVKERPMFCQYASGACDKSFDNLETKDAIFLYPSDPRIISEAVEAAKQKIAQQRPDLNVHSWRDLPIVGHIIFCEICKSTRFSRVVVADVTTLSFNVLFEIGYAIGLGMPVIPIRDPSYVRDKADFDALGLLDTLGYLDFVNSDELATKLIEKIQTAAFPFERRSTNRGQPLYVVKSPIETDGQIKLMSVIKKSAIRFRSFDPKETARISLEDAVRAIQPSMAVVAHLLDADRAGARVHNGRAALLAGMAMANQARVLMLQEQHTQQPIDYRDVVQSYERPSQVETLLIPFIRTLVEDLQSSRFIPVTLALKPLETVDFGDVAAENEINALRTYFFPTSQYNDVRRGHAQLVVGRKGTGKSAIFYSVRNAYWNQRSHLVLDLKPEGHQFAKLRDTVLGKLPTGVQQHVLSSFWTVLLLTEFAHRIVVTEYSIAHRDQVLSPLHDKLAELIGYHPAAEEGDFSERLLNLVDRLSDRVKSAPDALSSGKVSEVVYTVDVPALFDTLGDYLRRRDGVWLLFDNIDKGWPVDDVRSEDILLIRSLLDAMRKLQRQFERKEITCRAVVFIRNDIFTHLLDYTPDRGKDNPVFLDWSDQETLREMIRRRITASTGVEESFEALWARFFCTHVGTEESFSYILHRTLMRPRDLIRFLRQSVNVAVNRGHDIVLEGDILEAERTASEDQLQEVSFELHDVTAKYGDLLYAFIGAPVTTSEDALVNRLRGANVPTDQVEKVIRLLLWFGFLGVLDRNTDEERYAYEFHYGVQKLLADASRPITYVVHPTFRLALGVS
jgi:hypothetical protein